MEKNAFEMYNEYFDTLSQKCTAETLKGTLEIADSVDFQGYEHHLLENGLHVYKKGDGIVITTEDITGYAVIPGKEFYSGDNTADVAMIRSEDGTSLHLDIPGGIIEYRGEECECSLPSELEKVENSSKKGYKFKPTANSTDYHKKYKGNNMPSITEMLKQGTYKTNGDETTLGVYDQAFELEEKIWDIVREKKITLENAVRNAMSQGINIDDLTDEQLITKYMEEQGKEDKGVSIDGE